MNDRRAFSLIELLTVLGIIAILLSLLLPALSGAREASRRINCVNNLKQIALAIQEYVTAYETLPAGTYDASGPVESTPGGYKLSWIVSLLPYMEQMGMYRAVDFNAGAEAAANQTVRVTRITTLLCPSQDSAGWNGAAWSGWFRRTSASPFDMGVTSYAGVHHDAEAPIDADNHGVLFLNSRVRVVEIPDGLSETVFVGEVPAPSALGWISGTRATLRNTGHPINGVDVSAVKAAPPLPGDVTAAGLEAMIAQGKVEVPSTFVGGFGSAHLGGGANFAFGDGSVRFLRQTIDRSVYQRLGHRADGEVIDADSY